MAGKSFAHVATEVEVLKKEIVRLSKVVTVADLYRLGLSTHHDLKVHDFACFSLLHLNSPGVTRDHMLSNLFESLFLCFAHLKLKGFSDKVKKTRIHMVTLASFYLLA